MGFYDEAAAIYEHGIDIIFDDMVLVTRYIDVIKKKVKSSHSLLRSNLVVNEVTLLTRLGSLVGVGRTLLWIILACIGAAKSAKALLSFFWTRVKDKDKINQMEM